MEGTPLAPAADTYGCRLISFGRKYNHITPTLFNLHWILIEYRLKFKLLLQMLNINSHAPSYLVG